MPNSATRPTRNAILGHRDEAKMGPSPLSQRHGMHGQDMSLRRMLTEGRGPLYETVDPPLKQILARPFALLSARTHWISAQGKFQDAAFRITSIRRIIGTAVAALSQSD